MNDSIHKSHTKFVLNNLPIVTNSILDVGCGYGRIANEIRKVAPNADIQGVEICKSFADKFIINYENCFVGSIENYIPSKKFDLIIIITVLMYIEISEIPPIITKLWEALNKNGRLICIEPSNSFLVAARKLIKRKQLQPTGEDVLYFSEKEFSKLFQIQKSSGLLIANEYFGLLPILNKPILHHGLVLEKI